MLAVVVKLHHVPPSASVVPAAFRARTCHQYGVFGVSPLSPAVSVPVLVHVVSQLARGIFGGRNLFYFAVQGATMLSETRR